MKSKLTIDYASGRKLILVIDAEAAALLPLPPSPFGMVLFNMLGELKNVMNRCEQIGGDSRNSRRSRQAARRIGETARKAFDKFISVGYLRDYQTNPADFLAMLKEDRKELFEVRDALFGVSRRHAPLPTDRN